jgi:cell division protein FtsL
MSSLAKRSSALLATSTAVVLLGSLALSSTAQAGLEFSSDSSSSSDKFLTFHNLYGKDVMTRSDISIDMVTQLQSNAKTNTADIENLEKTVKEQTRLIEELKKNAGSSSSSSASEVSDLKRTVSAQNSELKRLASQVEDLKRSAGSSSSSSSSDLSSLKREVSDQDKQLDQLKRTVDDLSRKVK